MSRMVRKQIYIAAEQDEFLKQRAKDLDVTEAELIRQGIEQLRHAPVAGYRDDRAWQEELAFMRERAKLLHQGGERRWTRDELYDRGQ